MIAIVEATPDGVPSRVVCTVCEPDPASVWVRPAEDPTAGTLPYWIRIHDRQRRRRNS
jgi:hypothetical protein